MNKPTKETTTKEPIEPSASNQHGFSVIELLFAVATIGATAVAAGIPTPKIPRTAGD